MDFVTDYLWHSTGTLQPEIMLDTDKGFDRNFSSDENFYGPGIYLAENADYSHYNSKGMFRCTVPGIHLFTPLHLQMDYSSIV